MGMAKYYEDNFDIIENRFAVWGFDERLSETLGKAEKREIFKRKQKKKTEVVQCLECGRKFNFTGGEQNYYEKHNLSHPKRCAECRERRREIFRAIKKLEVIYNGV